MEVRAQTVRDLTIHIEIDEELDAEDALIYVALGDLFDVGVNVRPDEIVLAGKKHDVWAWIAFNIYEVEKGDA